MIMLEMKQYTTDELCKALEISKATFKVHKAKYLDKYDYKEGKVGRSKSYNITGYIDAQKSPFIQAIETIAGGQVKFSKEETAKKMLHYLLMKDRTIETNAHIAAVLQLDEDTVSKYINKFREYGILPYKHPVIPAVFDEEGNKVQDKIDRNTYVYSILLNQTGKRMIISLDDWRKYWAEFYTDVENLYQNLILIEDQRRERKRLAPLKPGINKYFMDIAKASIRNRYAGMDKGLANKHVSKQLTDTAIAVLSDYYQQLAS